MAQPRLDVAVDVRCLQDERFRRRGIGQFVAAILSKRAMGPAGLRLIAVTDGSLPALLPDHVVMFDAVQPVGSLRHPPAALIYASPMTHPGLPFASLLRGRTYCVAMAYDFIPLDHPEVYLATAQSELEYAARLIWLRDCDRFYAISDTTAARLRGLTGVGADDVMATGIPVRDDLVRLVGQAGAAAEPAYFLVSGGDDWRKNVEVTLAAHARSALMTRGGVRLVLFGGYPASRKEALARLHADAGGDPGLLSFAPHVPDAELATLYAGAVAGITPSRNEGFSMPIIEAAVFGCPVLAARCGAHEELLDDADLFDPDDVVTLQYRMELLLMQPGERDQMRARQASLAERFTSERVCGRFWADFGQKLLEHRARQTPGPAVLRGALPNIGFVSPLPPDFSGVADYSAATLRALGEMADVHVYTETVAPRVEGLRLAGLGGLDPVAYHGRHDAMVSVLGNSHLHLGTFNEFIESGGASILHDSRMLNFYYELFGEGRARRVAAAELGRAVDEAELRRWLADPAALPTLFLDEIARTASPLFVHSNTTLAFLAERKLPCRVLPFAPYRVLPDPLVTREGRALARKRLRQPEGRLLILSFGAALGDRALLDLLWSVEFLRAWGFDAMLVCVGTVAPSLEQYLRNIATAMGMAEFFTMTSRGASEEVYQLWLRAADYAIQLRTYSLGQMSGALLDCIAAGLPTVANDHLAASIDAPEWVMRVPDEISAVLIAEAIAAQVEAGAHRDRPLAARAELLERRGFPAYCRHLLEGLGFEGAKRAAA